MTLFKKILLFLLVGILGLIILGILSFLYFSKDLPTPDQIINRQVSESTKIYDRTGKVILYEISGGQKRTSISFEEIPQSLKDATIAIEDEKFYQEPGFSIRGILRALLVNLSKGKILQGGSTITQQLARNAFLSPEQTIVRKIKEFLLAIQLNRRYSKDKILNLYLNEIPYGPTIYGVESASQAYFNKHSKDLALAESAILAALPKAPSYYYPWGAHQKELLNRSRLVLKKMMELKKISPEDYKKANVEKVSFAPQEERGIKAPHFVISIQDYLVQKYGEDSVRLGGLKVITTLDWELQQAAEKAVLEGAKRNEELYTGKNAALIAQDPKTGQILAMVGSRDYFDTKNEGNFNVATQGLRQPGSALKPFVYLAAFEKGYTPDTILFDVPTEFDSTGDPQKSYHPENFDGIFRGPVSLRRALAQSINIPAVKTLYLVSIPDVLEVLKNFGVTTLNDPRRYGLSLVLGGGEVKLVDMVGAYSVLSQNGIEHPQTSILEIKDNKGNVLESFKDSSREVVSAQYPRLINDVLSDVDARSALYSNSLNLTLVSGHDIALKTGTSNDYRDAWVFGYTPAFVAGVWAGNNNNAPMQKKGSSILAALPIWHAFMSEALKNKPPEAFSRPDPVIAQKPILAGNYLVENQIHSILYYVNRKNPTGPYPSNPESDSQFTNWESGVLNWARTNLPNFLDFNKPGSTPPLFSSENFTNTTRPEITVQKPAVGEFVKSPLVIQAVIKSPDTLLEINISLNGATVQKITQNLSSPYFLNLQLSNLQLGTQNSLEIEARSQKGVSSKAGVIFYQ
ncbi:MAG: PBP1A family penicillin-binding protein [Patescibacteria group bacterium]